MKKLVATVAVALAAFSFSALPVNAAPSSDVSTVAGSGGHVWRWG